MLCSISSGTQHSYSATSCTERTSDTQKTPSWLKNQSPCFKDGPNSGRVSRGTGSFFTCAVFEVQMSTQASLCDPNPLRSCGGSDAQRAAPWPAHEESSRWENADCRGEAAKWMQTGVDSEQMRCAPITVFCLEALA